MGLYEWNYTQLKFKPETVGKNESTIGLPAGPIVDSFFPTVSDI